MTDSRNPPGTLSPSRPAPTPEDLQHAAQTYTEGPNVEASPWELQAARGEMPLEGPRAEDAPAREAFQASYDAWKKATVVFEAHVRALHEGDSEARSRAQMLALELARLHDAFMASSRRYFGAASG